MCPYTVFMLLTVKLPPSHFYVCTADKDMVGSCVALG